MLVCKFGGTSVGSPEAIERLVSIIARPDHRTTTRVVVVSAFSAVTDQLVALARTAETGATRQMGTRDPAVDEGLSGLLSRHRDAVRALKNLPAADSEALLAALDALHADLSRRLDAVAALGELSDRSMDAILSFGERFSAHIVAAAFRAQGLPAHYLDSRALIRTDSRFGNARVDREATSAAIQAFFAEGRELQVATGFIARDPAGRTTTLGRGGSDLSAALFGAALSASEIEIWTDVDGILSADPRLVKGAFSLAEVSYSEAMELSHFGAKVLYPPTVLPALEKGVPIRVLNSFNPDAPGTLVHGSFNNIDGSGPGAKPSSAPKSSKPPVKGISSIREVSLVRLQGPGMVGVTGVSSRLFGALARCGISVILITQASSEHSICFAIRPADASGARDAIREEFVLELERGLIEEPLIENELSVIAVVGEGMKHSPGIAGKVFHALGRNGINVVAIAQGSSELNISAVIPCADESKALNAIHEAFFLAGRRTVNLFLVGTGLIGSTLLEQLARQQEVLGEEHRIAVRLVGVANSRRMLFDVAGLDPAGVREVLYAGDAAAATAGPAAAKAGSAAATAGPAARAGGVGPELSAYTPDAFIQRIRDLNLPNSAFCDCTANDDVASRYLDILEAAVPVITPNKRANSGSLAYFKALRDTARASTIPFLYETTVCAGLPVISTLHDLVLAGDRVISIEAVLSGTLSFIFNNFDGSVPFSALVRQAKEKGYTEPDPRDDLNAKDAARKALILARECGMDLEFDDVVIEPILPAAALAAPTVDDFFAELEKADADFEAKRKAAAAGGKVLRYIARIDDTGARLSMAAVDAASPFRSLVDSDNLVVIYSERYNTLPLVVRGPGAGAAVTAGGVFADIVRIARTLV